jgi:hypothetical protein
VTAEATVTGLRERALAAWEAKLKRSRRRSAEECATTARVAADVAERVLGVRPVIDEENSFTDEAQFEVEGLRFTFVTGRSGLALWVDKCGGCKDSFEERFQNLEDLGRLLRRLASHEAEKMVMLCDSCEKRAGAPEPTLEERLVGVLRELIRQEVVDGD